MLDILSITSPIYLIILLGFAMTRAGIFARSDMRVLGKFVFNLALPALLFRAVAQRPIGEILNISYLLAYLCGTLLVIGCGYLWCRRVSGLDSTASTIHVMGMACTNSAYVGYPILLLTLAPVAGVSLALNMVVENLFIIPLLLFMASSESGASGRWHAASRALTRLLRIPLIIGLLAGLSVSLLGWKLPEPITRTVDLLATSSSALALFVVGGTLVGLSPHGLGSKVLPVSAGKLILHPLAMLLMVTALPVLGLPEIEPSLRMAVVLMSAMPMIGIYPTLAQAYGQEDFAAVAMLLTTVASFFTLSALLWTFKHFPVP
jgi:malonate transporter